MKMPKEVDKLTIEVKKSKSNLNGLEVLEEYTKKVYKKIECS